MQERKKPERKCLGCNEMKLKSELIRIVRSPEGEISLDFVGKKSGRGAYICPNRTCFLKARKAKRADHQLKTPIPDSVYDEMEAQLKDDTTGK